MSSSVVAVAADMWSSSAVAAASVEQALLPLWPCCRCGSFRIPLCSPSTASPCEKIASPGSKRRLYEDSIIFANLSYEIAREEEEAASPPLPLRASAPLLLLLLSVLLSVLLGASTESMFSTSRSLTAYPS